MLKIFSKFKAGLSKTTSKLFGGLFGSATLDDNAINTIEEALYNADFGVETTTEIIDAIKEAYKKEKTLRAQDAIQLAETILTRVLEGAEAPPLDPASPGAPTTICLLGVNGVGKTTTTGKLAHYYKNTGRSPILGACDTFRAAANEQINVWANRLNVEIVSSHHGADSAAVAYDAYAAAQSRGSDILLLDTAGRLHTKSHLMDELAKIKRVLAKHDPSAPQHAWMVVDGTLGSNSIDQARIFHEKFGLTGLIITKLDGTSRGGALVGIYRELKLPIYFVGLGEQPDDLQPFSIKNYINALLHPEDS